MKGVRGGSNLGHERGESGITSRVWDTMNSFANTNPSVARMKHGCHGLSVSIDSGSLEAKQAKEIGDGS